MKSTPIITKCIKHFQKWSIVCSFLLYLSACDSFVEVELPQSQLTNTAVFDTYATATASLTDIYSKMRDQGFLAGTSYGLSNQLGNYSDEINCYAAPGDLTMPFFTNSLLSTNSSIADFWNNSYNFIYSSNAVIEGVQASNKLTPQEKRQLKGEALFIRALIHFYLTNLYGDVPYIVSTNYQYNNTAGKHSTAEVYKFAIDDLQQAALLLETTYKNTERTRPNQYTVSSLLARLYLYNGNWAEASNSASSVLNATNFYQLENDLTQVFLKKSKETIWQFQPSRAGKNTDEAYTFIFSSGPPPLVSLDNTLVDSFNAEDLRKSKWIKAVTNQSKVWYHPFKYKLNNITAESLEYSIVFRLAEQYLIRAEARVNQGDLIGAKEDLNKIRSRAGLGNTTADSQSEILKAIQQERRWELFTEHGHRFFDLKRYGSINNVLSPIKAGWNSTDVLFPIPQKELNVNPNILPQNDGY